MTSVRCSKILCNGVQCKNKTATSLLCYRHRSDVNLVEGLFYIGVAFLYVICSFVLMYFMI